MRYRLIQELVAEYGVANLRFFIPMRKVHALPFAGMGFTSSNDPEFRTECVIDERRYKAAEGYKVELRAIDDQNPEAYFGSQSFYQGDFASLVSRAPEDFQVFVLVDEDGKYERVA